LLYHPIPIFADVKQIRHGENTLLVQSSAGFVQAALSGRGVDVVFLAVGGLVKQDYVLQHAYWHEVVKTVGARRIIPIHWDDFTLPLERPLVPMPFPFDNFVKSMEFVLDRGSQDDVDVKFAPTWTKIDSFVGL
jgi:L-ascorbate metabolism protein UlaG (beta-lactamase superfamily)